MFTKVKGTQDFLDLTLYNYIIDTATKHLALYHFHQIETPILEHTDLFKRGLGQETDVVSKEMFIINTGTDGDAICLRPEATASIVRAFVENGVQETPWKVFLHGPMFRYERPQKGRFRQFHQISIEVIGSKSICQDVQLIKMLDHYFHEQLNINNFALLLNFLGCAQDRAAYKIKLREFLDSPIAATIDELCKKRKETNIMRVFDCKNAHDQEIYQSAPFIADNLCPACQAEWQQLKDDLDALSISWAYQPTLVRGLDYYSKTVFEFVSNNLGAQNAFCAGGRYDSLVTQLGGKQDQPAIGAAIGIERLLLLLEPYKDSLRLPQLPALHLILPLAPEQNLLALLVADELQAQGLCTDIMFDGGSLKNMMRHANKLGAKFVIIIGENEQQTRSVSVKNMITGASESVQQAKLAEYLKG